VSLSVLALLVVSVLPADLCGSVHDKAHGYSDAIPESDCLNKTLDSDWKPVKQFLETGNTTRELAVNWTVPYLRCLLDMASEGILSENNSYLSELRRREITCTINELIFVEEIYELAKMDNHIATYNEEAENLIAKINSSLGKDELQFVEELIPLLKKSLAKHELMLDKVKCIHSLTQSCMRYSLNVSWISVLISEQEWHTRIRKKTNSLKHYLEVRERLENELFFGNYVNTVAYGVILLVGLVGNGTVLFIFAAVKDVRTKYNVTIFNLVIGDTLNLLINIPMHYMVHYSSTIGTLTGIWCHIFAMTRLLFFAVSALSVVSLSIQRYVITVHALWRPRILENPFLYLVAVWVLAILVSVPEAFIVSDRSGVCSSSSQDRRKVACLLNFLLYCVICPSVMAVFSILTARRLQNSTQDVPSQLCNTNMEQSRKRSARVLRVLALAFLISYVPYFTWNFVYFWFQDDIFELPNIVTVSIDNVVYHLLFLNVCFNPVALYIVSSTFRKAFIMYIFRCCGKVKRLQRPSKRVSTETILSQGMTEAPEKGTSFPDLRVRTVCE
jgi:gastrin-releasing peptide receptor